MVTIKTNNLKHIESTYSILRSNRLGYIDISVPKEKPYEVFLSTLNKDKHITYIDIQSLVAGQYSLRMVSSSDNELLDSKNLIVQ